jgi:hypothetical protein
LWDEKIPSSDGPWLNGSKLKDIDPVAFMISLRMECNVKAALANDAWISEINININLSMDHIC